MKAETKIVLESQRIEGIFDINVHTTIVVEGKPICLYIETFLRGVTEEDGKAFLKGKRSMAQMRQSQAKVRQYLARVAPKSGF